VRIGVVPGCRNVAAMTAVLTPQVRQPPRRVALRWTNERFVVTFLLGHALLGLVLAQAPALATVHAMAVCGYALYTAVSTNDVARPVYLAVYIACCDVMWRITVAKFPWEGAKWVGALLFAIVLVRFVRRPQPAMVAFAALLVPGVVLTLVDQPGAAKDYLSFNLSGPLLLALSAMALGRLRCTGAEVRGLAVAAIAPAVVAGTIAAWGTFAEGPVQFTDESNFETSGGFGPNQVSSLLGMGALLCVLLLLSERGRAVRIVLALTAAGLLAQGTLTFSRGGVLAALLGAGAGVVMLLQQPRAVGRVLTIVVLSVVAGWFLWGQLVTFTGGALDTRFSDVDTAGRTDIAAQDLDVFAAHPFLGVGVGRAGEFRASHRGQPAHTEFTRLAAEHGLLGVGAIVVLVGAGAARLVRARPGPERAWVMAMSVWSAASMANAGMRIGAIGLGFGLALVGRATDDRAAEPG
jgi:O-antigen ligase